MDKRLNGKAVICHFARPQVHLLYVIDQCWVILEPQNDPRKLYIVISNEVLGVDQRPIEVDVCEQLSTEHWIIGLFFIRISGRENRGHNYVDARFLRIELFRQPEEAKYVILKATVNVIVQAQVLRLAIPLNFFDRVFLDSFFDLRFRLLIATLFPVFHNLVHFPLRFSFFISRDIFRGAIFPASIKSRL